MILNHVLMGGSNFLWNFFFGSILISFMDELDNFFPIKLPKVAIWNDEIFFCMMGLIKNNNPSFKKTKT